MRQYIYSYVNVSNGTLRTMVRIRGNASAPFAVGSDYQGNPAAYARKADGSVWTATQGANGNWSSWTSLLGGTITSAPVFGH